MIIFPIYQTNLTNYIWYTLSDIISKCEPPVVNAGVNVLNMSSHFSFYVGSSYIIVFQ